VYLGPLDIVVHNARKNFTSKKFKQLANLLSIQVKEVLVEAHNSVSKVERYYAPLHCVYKIITAELKDKHVDKDVILQMVVKAINDIVRLDRLVLTLLVFRAYLQMTNIDPLSPSVTKRVEAICIAMKEV
jgi:hypothetical protein